MVMLFPAVRGPNDSRLFSTANGKVWLYSNNTEVIDVTVGNVAVTGDIDASRKMTAANLELVSGGNC